MPNVFLEVDLMLELVKNYDAKEQVIMSINVTKLVDISIKKLLEVFRLNHNSL